jgi:hypothetical protein
MEYPQIEFVLTDSTARKMRKQGIQLSFPPSTLPAPSSFIRAYLGTNLVPTSL